MKSLFYTILCIPVLLLISGCSMIPSLSSVSLWIPSSFKEMSSKALREKYPLKRKPRMAFSNQEGNTTIAYDFSPSKATEAEIPRLLRDITGLYRDSAQIHTSKVINIAGKKCGYLEMSPSVVNVGSYEIMLITSHQGRLFAADFHSTTSKYPKYKDIFKKSIMSLRFEN